MNELTTFLGGSLATDTDLPDYLRGSTDNNDLLAHASEGYAVLSIKGKQFTLVNGDQTTPIMNPKDPTSPAQWIPIVLVKANSKNSKSYYDTEFRDGEDTKPACFSFDGIRPDAQSEKPQCKSCAACPHNKFGSARQGKGKACADHVRTAIIPLLPDENGKIDWVAAKASPVFLRVPPASIKNLGDYGKELAARKIPYTAVITKLSFDMKEATPRLLFENTKKFLSESGYKEVKEVAESRVVEYMLHGNSQDVAVAEPVKAIEPPAPVEPKVPQGKVEEMKSDAADAIIEAATKSVAKKAPATKKEAPKVAETSTDLDVNDLDFS